MRFDQSHGRTTDKAAGHRASRRLARASVRLGKPRERSPRMKPRLVLKLALEHQLNWIVRIISTQRRCKQQAACKFFRGFFLPSSRPELSTSSARPGRSNLQISRGKPRISRECHRLLTLRRASCADCYASMTHDFFRIEAARFRFHEWADAAPFCEFFQAHCVTFFVARCCCQVPRIRSDFFN